MVVEDKFTHRHQVPRVRVGALTLLAHLPGASPQDYFMLT